MKFDLPHLQKNVRIYLAPTIAIAGALTLGLALAGAPHPVHASSKQAQATGAAVFHDKGCQHCHGADLEGTDRGPDLFTIGKKWHRDRIEKQIIEGGNGMPAFGDLLQPDEIKSLVDYLSAKRKPIHKSPAPKTPAPPAPVKPSNDDSGE
jgi:mono/diheme cytochrome c family protein